MAPRKSQPTPEPNPEQQSDQELTVIRMYQEGYKLSEITKETHVPRATIYWLLKRNGISTDRIARASGTGVSGTELLDRLRATERENGALRDQVAKLQTLVDYLQTFTRAVRPSEDGHDGQAPPPRPSRPRTTGRN